MAFLGTFILKNTQFENPEQALICRKCPKVHSKSSPKNTQKDIWKFFC